MGTDETKEPTRRAAVVVFAEVDDAISDLDAARVLEQHLLERIDLRTEHSVIRGGMLWTVRLVKTDSLQASHGDIQLTIGDQPFRRSSRTDLKTVKRSDDE